MASFFDCLGNSTSLAMLAFVLASTMVFASGGDYTSTPFIGWLGLLYYVPLSLLGAAGAAFGGVVLPLLVIAFFAYAVVLNKFLGPLDGIAFVGLLAIFLGA